MMTDRSRRSPLQLLLIGLIGLWQRASAFRSPRCRFHPTCSAYGREAIVVHGALRGSWLAIRRVGRCHPWNPGGVDHVPPADHHADAAGRRQETAA
jgi:hypothetical protein